MSTIAIEELRSEIESGYVIKRWPQGPRIPPRFTSAESSFIVGATHKGKSRLLMRLAKKFQTTSQARIIDAFGAENDSESCVWLMDPKNRDSTLMITGNEVEVEGWDLKMPIQDFTLEKARAYKVIVTDRALFGPFDDKKWDYRYYAALARIFELCKRREGESDLIVLCIRELWNVVYSVMKAGISRDEQAAQGEFRKLHNQRYHAKVAVVMDTQRYTDAAATVRTLVDYRYVKGFGSQPLPNELHFLYKPHLFGSIPGRYKNPREWMIRNTPLDQFVLLTRENGVALGWYADIPWHIRKGDSPLRKLGITVKLKEQEPDEERKANNDQQEAKYIPSNNEQHRRMLELRKEGYTNNDVVKKFTDDALPMTLQKVRYHLEGRCHCELSTSAEHAESEAS